ncbi:type II toxin-antitoxin system Phd/YefM family antitoxin [Actinomadura sp. 3N508]|uniref:type II toxin-antitoxin system Phd/YefM family antitoxin n=1 Tax=Actinomadura sp. 3N508 TaxID=3375153 RepID=UPI00378A293C
MTFEYPLREARAQLGALAERAAHGEDIVFTKHGRHYVRLVGVPTYTYAIEVADYIGGPWRDDEYDDSVGEEPFSGSPQVLAESILNERIIGVRPNEGLPPDIRVLLWRGARYDHDPVAEASPPPDYYGAWDE